jgi:hypothetical protein
MKKTLLSIIAIAIAHASFAQSQWLNSGANIYNSNTGNVGIGTTSPESGFKLDVNGFGAIGNQGSARVYQGTIDATHAFIQSRDNSINQELNFSARGYSFQVGNVGIGTMSPESGFKLDVNGLGAIGNQGSARIYQGTIDATHAFIQSRDNSVNQILNFSASAYNFQTGNVGVGTSTPDARLAVNRKTIGRLMGYQFV